ncbi:MULTISPECIES: KTSC domain-containing protein, partial [unclassified Bradyrhizobium]
RQWYYGLSPGRVGRCQACQGQWNFLFTCHDQNKTPSPSGGGVFVFAPKLRAFGTGAHRPVPVHRRPAMIAGRPLDEGRSDRHIPCMRRDVQRAGDSPAPRISNEIHMRRVQSTGIEAAGYGRAQRTLLIRYPGGSTYDYFAVPAKVFKELLDAESKGRFVNWYVKPRYRYKRVG